MNTAIGLLLVALMGGAAMAETALLGSGTSGTLTNRTFSSQQEQLPPESDEARLLLQLAADQGGSFTSYPSEISGALRAAETAGWLKTNSPPSTPIKDESGTVIGGSTSGFTSYILTEAGRKELAERNARLGPAATRMEHETKFIPGAGVIPYGAAKRVPLNRAIQLQDGGVVLR